MARSIERERTSLKSREKYGDEMESQEEMIRCEYDGAVMYVPKKVFMMVVYRAEMSNRKFVSYEEGAQMYSISSRRFHDLARDANAVHHYGKRALVKVSAIDSFLESCKDS